MKHCYQFTILLFTFLVVVNVGRSQNSTVAQQSDELVFPKGEKISNNNFTGTAYVYRMVTPDSLFQTSVGNVTFEPKARTNWHKHPGGQILLVTDGAGFYQERGKPVQAIRKGDVVRIPPDTEHWHGAAPNCQLTHIAIGTRLQEGEVKWLLPVTEEDYNSEK